MERVPALSSSRLRAATVAFALSTLACLTGPAAEAQEPRTFRFPRWPAGIAVSSGAANLARPSDDLQLNWEFHFEPHPLRLFDRLGLPDPIPIAGLMAAGDGSTYAYAGARIERPFRARWIFSPSFAAGFYSRDRGKELGGVLEFRTGLEIAYRLGGSHRLGAALYHLSNAGINGDNPGTESLLLTYSTGLR